MKFLLILFTILPLVAQDQRETIRQWVQTERIISEEKTNWQVEKKNMQALLDLYQKELTLLNEELGKSGASAELIHDDKEKLEKKIKQYRESQQLLSVSMAKLLPRVKSLITQLPTPLAEEVAIDSDFLASPEALEKPRDTLKSILAVLTASGKFNRSITVAEETRLLPSGKKMTVSVIYLGLCRAYYTTREGDTAGIGTPEKNGWKWKSEPSLADEIRHTISVYQKDKQPQLIKLPVKVKTPSSKP